MVWDSLGILMEPTQVATSGGRLGTQAILPTTVWARMCSRPHYTFLTLEVISTKSSTVRRTEAQEHAQPGPHIRHGCNPQPWPVWEPSRRILQALSLGKQLPT